MVLQLLMRQALQQTDERNEQTYLPTCANQYTPNSANVGTVKWHITTDITANYQTL